MKSRWREASRARILKVINDNPGMKGERLRRLVNEAYPFGHRSHYPYKVWLEELNKFFPKDKRVITPDNIKNWWVS